MLNFDNMEKGKSLIILPDFYFRNNMPIKAYFLFITEKYYANGGYPRIIVTIDLEDINKYTDLEDFRKKQLKEGFDKETVLFIDDLLLVKDYQEKILKKYENVYLFINEKKQKLENAIKYFYPLKDKINILNTLYYYGLKRRCSFFRARFYIYIICYYFIGTIKWFTFYPIIFLFDLIKLSFDKYLRYKKTLNEIDSKENKHIDFMLSCMNTPQAEIEDIRNKRVSEHEEAKKEYLNSNIAFLTLIVSLSGFIVTQGWNNYQIRKLEDKNEIIYIENDFLRKEVNRLKIIEMKYNEKKSPDQFLFELRNISNSIESINEAVHDLKNNKKTEN